MKFMKSGISGIYFLEAYSPKKTPILFGFRNASTLSTTSSDGTIPLKSQLRHAAHQQATSLRGFDEDHLSILDSKLTGSCLNEISREKSASGREYPAQPMTSIG